MLPTLCWTAPTVSCSQERRLLEASLSRLFRSYSQPSLNMVSSQAAHDYQAYKAISPPQMCMLRSPARLPVGQRKWSLRPAVPEAQVGSMQLAYPASQVMPGQHVSRTAKQV